MRDLLLLIPPSPYPLLAHVHPEVASIPALGIGYLSSYITENTDYRTYLLNLYPGLKNINNLLSLIKQTNAKIVGISAMTENFNNGVKISKIIKENISGIKIVFGGPHVTFTDFETLYKYPFIDFVVRNEGEETFLELAKYIIDREGKLENIRGLTYRKEGKILRNPARKFIENLDKLPFPDRNVHDLDGYYQIIHPANMVITSRGCPGACKFCAATAMSGGKYRLRSIDNIVEEIKILVKDQKEKVIFFGDDTITADIDRFYNLMQELRKLKIKWHAESRVDVIDKKLVKEMKKSGCVGIQFGVESGSQEILDIMNKRITLEQIENAIKLTRYAGIEVVASVMIGIPGDTLESIKKTIKFSLNLRDKYGVTLVPGVTTPYPGTFISRFPKLVGIKNILEKNYDFYSTDNPILDLENISAKEIRNIYYDFIKEISKPIHGQRKRILDRLKLAKLVQRYFFDD